MSLGFNSFASLSMPSSSRVSVTAADSRESMRGLNTRLADYLAQVRTLQEANSKLEAQIRERVSSRGSEERDWTQYDKTIAHLRGQLRELNMDNARLMLQIDNARLAADDFKVKFEAEHAMRQGVDQDVANLRKMIDDTHMSRMQLESEIESLKEELIFLNKNHEEDVANLKGQIRGSSVDVQMEARRGDDLSETIDKIRQQYEKAMQKSREESEAWYQAKFDSMTAEASKSTETIQQGKSEVNDLRRQKQMLEIDLQALRSMNHSLEDNLKDTAGRCAQEMNHHNATIQQLEAELGDVHAQVGRQGAEYQALLNIKIKLEEEIATYQHLLEGTGVDDSIRDTGNRSGGNIRGAGAGAREDVKGTGTRDVNVKGTGTRDDVNVKGTGAREDVNIKGPGTREDVKVKGTGAREDVNIKGPGTRDDVSVKGTGAREDVNIKGPGARDNVKDNGAPEDPNSHVRDTTVPEDDLVEFSLEQALNAAPPVPTPDQIHIISEEIQEGEVVSRSELKLSAANGTVEDEEEDRGRDGVEEEAVVPEEVPPSRSTVEDAGGDVGVKQEEAKPVAEEKKEEAEQKIEVKPAGEEKKEVPQKIEEKPAAQVKPAVEVKKEDLEQKVEEKPTVGENKEAAEQKIEEKPAGEEKKEDPEQKVEVKPAAEENKEAAKQKTEEKQQDPGQEAEKKHEDVVRQDGEVLEELEVKPVLNEEEQKE
ncbi:keratin, type I cytoskeletal 18-like isoform X2 [Colossoma macropomum]|uniref:keratin, type I cytoskeletal 18-like isoform X2 n=1 Tax=Colossoma macropomum TaxID=42526 RepID=UPI0018648A32|nr:keratin, type I cytoskeletal 18-like isoform X2 [Colossoma macropomum]